MNIGAFPASPTFAAHQTLPSSSRIIATNLARLLSRLDRKLGFTTTHEQAPPPSSIERAKIAANLEYARNLLLTLERESETIHNPAQRQSILAQLAQQKQAVRRLNERLQTSPHDDDDDDDDDDEDEDGQDEGQHEETGTLYSDEDSSSDVMMTGGAPSGLPAYSLEDNRGSLERSYSPATESSGIRNRFPTHQETRTALLGSRGQGEDGEELSEKQLDDQRIEQEDITTDMLALAQALKENSLRFSEELQKEKAVLDLATEGLDKNVMGIEGAGRKMGQLRRDESVGWLWGILYPAIIVALSFFILIILFLAPKLRWW
ncbi:hypothetical protein Q9L58_006173 [Maublancomyces gigas]|uniref:Synaptobrevin n=1 Tax=Discina gigas TaxID=1032678 RepID=A0ABR3GGB6_9PEZI